MESSQDFPTPSPETKADIFEAVGTCIQNGAGYVDYHLPEYVAHAITENLIASDWFRNELGRITIEAMVTVRRQIARDIQAARPTHSTRDYTAAHAAFDTATAIARGGVA